MFLDRDLSWLDFNRRVLNLAEDERVPPLPKGLGTLIMDAFGVPPSKRLGDLMKQLSTDAEAGDPAPHQRAEYYIEYLREHRDRYDL